jgi:hypothetical protein
MWVRQGRTDAWIAHKLDIPVAELARFKREHTLDDSDEGTRARPADPLSVPAPEPRWEVFEEGDEETEEAEEEDEAEREPARPRRSRRSRSRRPAREPAADAEADEDEEDEEAEEHERAEGRDAGEPDGGGPRRRRRGRRGGRRHRARRNAFEATFDHGSEGYGLWLDPAVADNPVYSEHWAGHRAVTVTVEPEAITIRRAAGSSPDAGPDPAESAEDT